MGKLFGFGTLPMFVSTGQASKITSATNATSTAGKHSGKATRPPWPNCVSLEPELASIAGFRDRPLWFDSAGLRED